MGAALVPVSLATTPVAPASPVRHELTVLGHNVRALGRTLLGPGPGSRWQRLREAAQVFATLGLVVTAAAIVSLAPPR